METVDLKYLMTFSLCSCGVAKGRKGEKEGANLSLVLC